MAYRVFWRIPQQVLCVELEGELSLEDFNSINRAIMEHLEVDTTTRSIALLVDITRPGRIPQAFEQLRASQTYVRRNDLKYILIAGTNKFMRLMMLLTFNLCRPSLRFFDDIDNAVKVAQLINPPVQTPIT